MLFCASARIHKMLYSVKFQKPLSMTCILIFWLKISVKHQSNFNPCAYFMLGLAWHLEIKRCRCLCRQVSNKKTRTRIHELLYEQLLAYRCAVEKQPSATLPLCVSSQLCVRLCLSVCVCESVGEGYLIVVGEIKDNGMRDA